MQKIKINPSASADINLLVAAGADREVATKFHSFIAAYEGGNVSQTVSAIAAFMSSGYSLVECDVRKT